VGRTPGGESRLLDSIVLSAIRRPTVVLLLWALACGLAGWSALDLRVDTTMGSALNRTDDSWRRYQRSLDLHGGDEFVSVALERGATPFARPQLEAILDLTDQFESLEFIRRVDSLSTVALIRSDRDGAVNVGPGLTRETLESSDSIQTLLDQVRRDRIVPGSLVSWDERVLALNLVFGADVDGDREAAVSAIRRILASYPGAAISGVPVVRADAGARTRREIAIFVPATVVLVAAVVLIIFRRLYAAVVPLAIGGVSSLVCVGVMALAGVTLSFSTSVLPSVILALGCAYTMHFLSASEGCHGEEELSRSLAPVIRPVMLSGVTTALGFLAMSVSRIGLIRDLATYGALGALLVSLSALTLAPALLALSPGRRDSRPDLSALVARRWAPPLAEFVRGSRKVITVGWVAALVISGVGLSRLAVSSDVIMWFPEDGPLRLSYEAIRSRLSGITPLNVLIEADDGSSVATPEMLIQIDSLTAALQNHEHVGKAISVSDALRLMHRELGESTEGALPDTQALVDQYLLLLDGVEQMDDVIGSDRLSANILIRADNNSSADIMALASWVEDWWSANGAEGYSAHVTGIMYEFGRAQDEIAYGGIVGLMLAVLTIGVLLLLFFGNLRVASVALVANIAPISVLFGLVGWLGVPLDAATVCVASLSLGIAVDDTIHVVSGFQDGRRRGLDRSAAVEASLRRVLPALLFTTITIGAGFGVLALSDFSLIRNLGLMMAGAAGICLAADAVLLPALLGDDSPSSGNPASTLK